LHIASVLRFAKLNKNLLQDLVKYTHLEQDKDSLEIAHAKSS